MSETPQELSTYERVGAFPWLSTAVLVTPAAVAVDSGVVMLAAVAAPVVSPALGIAGVFRAFDKKRSGLSRVFAAAAGVTGLGGTALMAGMAGPDAGLGVFIFPLLSAPVAALFNLASHFTRNKRFGAAPPENKPAPEMPNGP